MRIMNANEVERLARELLKGPPFFGDPKCIEGARQMAIYRLKVRDRIVMPVEQREGWCKSTKCKKKQVK